MTNWIDCTLRDLFEFEYGKGLTKKDRDDDGSYPVYGSNGIVGYHSSYLIKGPSIIVGRKGAVGEVHFELGNLWPIDTTYFIHVSPSLDFKFSYYLLKSLILGRLDKSTAIPGLNRNDAYDTQIRLFPLPEQRAIVAKIEQLFSELDNGVANLTTALEQLKVYRQAVLKKAFEGELTKAWRAKQTDLPTAEELLEQIMVEREIAADKKIKQFPPLEEDELINLPSLPQIWIWLYLGNVLSNSPQNGLYKPANQYGEGTDIIRIDDFYSGKLIRTSGFKKVRLTDSEVDKYSIDNGHLLINRVNSIEYLGKCGLVDKLSAPTVFESNIMKLEVLEHSIVPKYISLYLTSHLGIQQIRKNAKHAVNQASINQTDVSLTPIPLTSYEEQHQIVQEIESRLSVCDKVEETIKDSLVKAEALRQSILKKAFEGKLLTEHELEACLQQPDWEPAEKLLERIKKAGGKAARKFRKSQTAEVL